MAFKHSETVCQFVSKVAVQHWDSLSFPLTIPQLPGWLLCRAHTYEPKWGYAVYSGGLSLVINVRHNKMVDFLLSFFTAHLTLLWWCSGNENWMGPTVLSKLIPIQLTFLTSTHVSFILWNINHRIKSSFLYLCNKYQSTLEGFIIDSIT